MEQLLSVMKPEEPRDALNLIDVFEQWDMTLEEADEWRRRIVARQQFLELNVEIPPADASLPQRSSR